MDGNNSEVADAPDGHLLGIVLVCAAIHLISRAHPPAHIHPPIIAEGIPNHSG